MNGSQRADWRTPTVVLVCGGLILTLGMGIRHGFGLFLAAHDPQSLTLTSAHYHAASE